MDEGRASRGNLARRSLREAAGWHCRKRVDGGKEVNRDGTRHGGMSMTLEEGSERR